jgi:hypothetical protein
MADTISWIATVATIVAASMTAANLGSRVTGFGFVIFTFGALCWIAVGVATHQPALLWTNVVLTVLDIFGVWRWLGRQSRVEEGARAAAEASEVAPGEALFPVSMLNRAPIECDGKSVGHCIDGMAGCRTGMLTYIVVSQGGVGGVGETLRRLPWRSARVEGERVIVQMSPAQLEGLQELERDQWPAR